MNSLNPQQMEAVRHREGAMLVLAGPGSGKTTMIIHRVQYMRERYRIAEDRILVLTYTRAAAQEMRGRFLRLLGTDHTGVLFGTFHSVFWRMLREQGHFADREILQEEEALAMGIRILKKEWNIPAAEARELLTERKLDPQRYERWKQLYEEEKTALKKADFDDLMLETEKMLKKESTRNLYQERFSYILIDEFQDVNPVQYRIVRLLAGTRFNVFAVGDDDQAIYGFRGAAPGIMRQFPVDFPGCRIISLKCNYRSTRQIVEFSAKVIANNQERYEKEIFSQQNKEGEKVRRCFFREEQEECQAIIRYARSLSALEDLAVLFRTAHQADALRRTLADYNIAYQMREYCSSPYEHWIGEDIADYLRAARGNREALRRIVEKSGRRIPLGILTWKYEEPRELLGGSMSMEVRIALEELLYELRQLLQEPPCKGIRRIAGRLGYMEYLRGAAEYWGISEKELEERFRFWKESAGAAGSWRIWEQERQEQIQLAHRPSRREGIRLMTLHASKGLEFPAVWIPELEEGALPHERAGDIEEERRLFYVGCTRAKDQLIISRCRRRKGGKREASPFWKETEPR